MSILLAGLLVVLADGLIVVPPSQWSPIPVSVPKDETTVSCSFEVREGDHVQALLLDHAQTERFRKGRAYRQLHATGFQKSARFRYRIPKAGNYVLIVDNRAEPRESAQVSLRLELSTSRFGDARELPEGQRRLVVTLSLLFLGAVVVTAARLFMKHAT